MNKKIFFPAAIAAAITFTAVSCGKDKAPASESHAVNTTKDGTVYTIDTLHSKIEWKGYKIVKTDNSSHFGTIKFESGDLTVKDGKLESGKFVANMSTLDNADLNGDADQKGKLEGHLKSEDFFDVEKFPTASYEITEVAPISEGDYNTQLSGNLTIKGITKPAQFKANVAVKGDEVSIATEPMDINREDFGVKFQMPVANGILKNEVNLQIFIKAFAKQ